MRRRRLIISIDVERDIPRFFRDSYVGVAEVLASLLDELLSLGFVADMFVETQVLRSFPDLLRRARARGHFLGTHGWHVEPRLATELEDDEMRERLLEGRDEFRNAFGSSPMAFREANFAVDSRLVRMLPKFEYLVDSSVLPNRRIRRHRLKTVVDHRGCPTEPYRPALDDYRKRGNSLILEIPVTENPLKPNTPLGTGSLNEGGVEATLAGLRATQCDPVTFLIHPWECIDLAAIRPDLPEWVLKISHKNAANIRILFDGMAKEFVPSSLTEVAEQHGVNLR